jgi:uncharacterized protein (DUF2344 family)
MELNDILTQWIIPFGSVGISIWFASSAKKDSEKAQQTLTQINESISSWINQIMNTSNEILQSNPSIIDKKVKLEKIETIKTLVESLKDSIKTTMNNPQGGAPGHTQEQLIKELMASLNGMIDKFDK